ncbi:hypothetical protein RBG61_03670 [Paludicola sp. MB14-C6]|uniref:hypothetical protein n=1 Tax=Paludihabitans sp. MB14-C6 TaxID=3070656 RepID=UPI0027DC7BFD|nr:hypothetical protein [Paludicola sp. MB14-C6]WMJ23774.1 hypothetical protein RBG61_03670 [Paludicola sp. MB14-C6]
MDVKTKRYIVGISAVLLVLFICGMIELVYMKKGKEVLLLDVKSVYSQKNFEQVHRIILTDTLKKAQWSLVEQAKQEEAIGLLKMTRCNSKEIDQNRSATRDKRYTMTLYKNADDKSGITYNFNESFSTFWIDDGVKPSFSYAITNSEALKKQLNCITQTNDSMYDAYNIDCNQQTIHRFVPATKIRQIITSKKRSLYIDETKLSNDANFPYPLSIETIESSNKTKYIFYQSYYLKCNSDNNYESYYYNSERDSNYITELISKPNEIIDLQAITYSGIIQKDSAKSEIFIVSDTLLTDIHKMIAESTPLQEAPQKTSDAAFYRITLPTMHGSYMNYSFGPHYFIEERNGIMNYYQYGANNIYTSLQTNSKKGEKPELQAKSPYYPITISSLDKSISFQDVVAYQSDHIDIKKLQKQFDINPCLLLNTKGLNNFHLQLQFADKKPEKITGTIYKNGNYETDCSIGENFTIGVPYKAGTYDYTFTCQWTNSQIQTICFRIMLVDNDLYELKSYNEIPLQLSVIEDIIVTKNLQYYTNVVEWKGEKISEPIVDINQFTKKIEDANIKPQTVKGICEAIVNFKDFRPEMVHLYTNLSNNIFEEIQLELNPFDYSYYFPTIPEPSNVKNYVLDCYWKDSHIQYIFVLEIEEGKHWQPR